MKEKTCTRCFLSLPATTEYFYYTSVNGKKYLRSICKECSKDAQITNYDKHRGEILDKHKAKRLEEKEQRKNVKTRFVDNADKRCDNVRSS